MKSPLSLADGILLVLIGTVWVVQGQNVAFAPQRSNDGQWLVGGMRSIGHRYRDWAGSPLPTPLRALSSQMVEIEYDHQLFPGFVDNKVNDSNKASLPGWKRHRENDEEALRLV